MQVEITTIGERGQAVIPKSIREKMPAPKGTVFTVVMVDKDILIMKRLDKKHLLGDFRVLRESIKNKLSEGEIIEEVKKAHKN